MGSAPSRPLSPFPPPGRGRAALSPPGPLSASAASVPAAAPPPSPERQHPRQYWESRGSPADHTQVFSFSRLRRHPSPLPFARHMCTAATSHVSRPVVADVTRTDIIVLGCWHAPPGRSSGVWCSSAGPPRPSGAGAVWLTSLPTVVINSSFLP